jgi:hypothetical protein
MQENTNTVASSLSNVLGADEQQNTTETVQNKPFLDKLRNVALTLMLLMISLGQWNDTKDVVLSAYEEIISRWTNTLDYSKISKLRIGFSSDYIENLLGDPQVVKVANSTKDVMFSYYSTPKYLLTTAMTNNRLSGFSILALKNDFYAPVVYLNKSLNKGLLDSYLPTQDKFVTDFGNSEHFIETYELSHSLMFYDFSLGVVNTGSLSNDLRNEIRDINGQLNRGEDIPFNKLSIPQKILPNYYSVSELPSHVMLESLLSRFEMAALFNYEAT